MSRYRGPRLRIVRRLGELPGLTKKTTARKYGPGQHGPSKLTKKITLSDYSLRLQEKQKLRYNYGISETQLYKYLSKIIGSLAKYKEQTQENINKGGFVLLDIPFINPSIEDFASIKMRYKDLKE
jgi:ribosomal protein S4